MTSFFRGVEIGVGGKRLGELSGGGGGSSPPEGGRGELGLPIRPDFFLGGGAPWGGSSGLWVGWV